MHLTLTDRDGVVLDRWGIADEFDRDVLFALVNAHVLPRITEERIRIELLRAERDAHEMEL